MKHPPLLTTFHPEFYRGFRTTHSIVDENGVCTHYRKRAQYFGSGHENSSPDATIADLQKKAAEYEETAKTEPSRTAIGLREKAKLYLWIAALKTGKWMS
jgi:hypothetical protein